MHHTNCCQIYAEQAGGGGKAEAAAFEVAIGWENTTHSWWQTMSLYLLHQYSLNLCPHKPYSNKQLFTLASLYWHSLGDNIVAKWQIWEMIEQAVVLEYLLVCHSDALSSWAGMGGLHIPRSAYNHFVQYYIYNLSNNYVANYFFCNILFFPQGFLFVIFFAF